MKRFLPSNAFNLILVELIFSCTYSAYHQSGQSAKSVIKSYTTYRISGWDQSSLINADLADLKYIENNIRKELNKRQMVEKSGAADIQLNLHLEVIENDERIFYPRHFFDPQFSQTSRTVYVDYSDYELRKFSQSIISVVLNDSTGEELIWESAGKYRNYFEPANRYKAIDKSISGMFRRFPGKN